MANVAVLGAGTMGHALALVFALGGHRVRLTDSDPATCPAAQSAKPESRVEPSSSASRAESVARGSPSNATSAA